MEIRKLVARDTFPVIKILGKLDIKNMIDNIFQNNQSDAEEYGQSIMVTVIDTLVTNLPLIENDLFDLLGDLTGEGRQAVEELPLIDFIQLVTDFVQREEFKHFFKLFTSQTTSGATGES